MSALALLRVRRRVAVAACLLAVGSAACRGESTAVASASAPRIADAIEPAATVPHHPDGTPMVAPGPKGDASSPEAPHDVTGPTPGATEPATTAPAPDYGPDHDNAAIRVRLSATCVTHGTTIVAVLDAQPRAGVSAIVGYADNRPHGAMTAGETDASGLFEWRFAVAPTAPAGVARLLARTTGADWEGRGGTTDIAFRVVEREQDC